MLQRRYVFGPGIDQPLVQYEGSGTTDRRFMGSDERGSVISLTDGSGTLININRYDEYGKPQATNLGRFQYTGQKWIGEAGLYDYKARSYLPHLGIFAQTDPIGFEGGINLYVYVEGDPVNLVDPFGLEIVETVTAPSCSGILVLPKGRSDSKGWYCASPFAPANIRSIQPTPSTGGGGIRVRRLLTRNRMPVDCHPLAKAISEAVADFGSAFTDYSSGVIAAGLIGKSPPVIAIGEAGALFGTGLQSLGAAGRLLATGNVTRARYDAVGIAFSFLQSQSKAGQLAVGFTGGQAVALRIQLTPGQDCKVR